MQYDVVHIGFKMCKLPTLKSSLFRLALVSAVLLLIQSAGFSKDYDIIKFGAISDGKTLNTKAIQKAIDQAFKDGGGRVLIPSGRFLTGSIILKNGVELNLAKKATLLGSTTPGDYVKLNRWFALVMADEANDIAITGKGTIDGQGLALALHIDSLFYAGQIDSSKYDLAEKRPLVTIRPQIIEFVNCRNIKVTEVTIKNAASWVQSYFQCSHVEIDKIRVESDTYWNNDGIDIIDSKNVRITNSYFNSSDDGICLKSYNYPRDQNTFCDSIYIGNCTVRSSASAIKFGTASYSGFKNITIENIKVFDTFRSAIALESFDNGSLENVLIQNVNAKNTGNAIFIRLGKRYADNRVGSIRNITIRNVKVSVPFQRPDADYVYRGPALPYFHNIFPSSITGIPGYPVENVVLEDIQITYPGRGHKGYSNSPLSRLTDIPEQQNKYPEFSMFGELPAWGFYVRHVDGLKMKNVTVRIKDPDYRPAFVFDDVNELFLNSVQVKGDEKSNPIILHNTENVEIVE